MKTGFVTTTRMSHATPGALYSKTTSRFWECENDIRDDIVDGNISQEDYDEYKVYKKEENDDLMMIMIMMIKMILIMLMIMKMIMMLTLSLSPA